jgi:hypothetical protein
LVAVPDLGSGAERRGGSSPFVRTKIELTASSLPEAQAVFLNVWRIGTSLMVKHLFY